MGFIVLGTSLILFYNGINHGMLSFRIYSEIVMLQFGIVIVINCPNCGSIWQVLGSYIKNKFSHIIIFINFSFFKSWHNVIISIMWSVLGASSYSPAIMTFFVVSHVSIRTHLALPHYVVCMGAWYGFRLFFSFFFSCWHVKNGNLMIHLKLEFYMWCLCGLLLKDSLVMVVRGGSMHILFWVAF